VAFRPGEVAEKLGIGRTHVYALINQGALRHVVLAGRWMVLADDLDAFIERLKVTGEPVAFVTPPGAA